MSVLSRFSIAGNPSFHLSTYRRFSEGAYSTRGVYQLQSGGENKRNVCVQTINVEHFQCTTIQQIKTSQSREQNQVESSLHAIDEHCSLFTGILAELFTVTNPRTETTPKPQLRTNETDNMDPHVIGVCKMQCIYGCLEWGAVVLLDNAKKCLTSEFQASADKPFSFFLGSNTLPYFNPI